MAVEGKKREMGGEEGKGRKKIRIRPISYRPIWVLDFLRN